MLSARMLNGKKLKMEAIRLSEAQGIFNDIEEMISSSFKKQYLLSILSKEDVIRVMNEISKIFQEHEDFEKCSKIQEWKKEIEKISD